ncbi:MAG: ABC transporter ATP-binding protein [Clostridia bacterium]|nr:ABC transporter ATP-binding protein [Clostridia bacterium]
MESTQKTMKTGTLIRRFLPYYRRYWKTVLFDLCCAALTSVAELVLPMIVRAITGLATSEQGISAIRTDFVLKMGGLYLILRVIDAAANYYMQYIGHVMGSKLETDMRTDLFHHLQQLSFSYFSHTKVGQIMSRITSDLFEVTEFCHHCPEEFLIAGIKIIVSFILLIRMNVLLTLLMFGVLPFMVFFAWRYNHKFRQAFKLRNRQVGEINAQVEDSLLGVRVVKSFANEDMEEEKFGEGNRKFLGYKATSYRYMAEFGTSNRVFDALMYILVVVVGALMIRNDQLEVADYAAYLLYVSVLLNAIRRIVEFIEQFQRGMTGIERFYEIMDAPEEITDAPDAKPLTDVRGEVVFDGVGFHYQDSDSDVLHHLSMTVKPGQSVALVGPSGAGKTTLCNLIPRFYDVTEGRILIDGQDVRSLQQKSLRRAIGMVQQDVYLFSGSVLDNILYGKPGATREEAVEAAKLAGAHDFIAALPDGYDTYVGERGVRLSGGQKQRISIARVFLKNPPILILDEATSALDNESERLVQQSLESLAKGRTVFTIAHRLTTIRNADVIWVLTEQGIEETGSHEELMRRGGLYAGLYRMYTEQPEPAQTF